MLQSGRHPTVCACIRSLMKSLLAVSASDLPSAMRWKRRGPILRTRAQGEKKYCRDFTRAGNNSLPSRLADCALVGRSSVDARARCGATMTIASLLSSPFFTAPTLPSGRMPRTLPSDARRARRPGSTAVRSPGDACPTGTRPMPAHESSDVRRA